MKSNGRRAWRRWLKGQRKRGEGWGADIGRCPERARYTRRHRNTDQVPEAVSVPVHYFSPRSLVGMSNSAKKRLARIDWLSLDSENDGLSFTEAWQLSCAETCSQYVRECRPWFRIGEGLRPCPGCQTCGPLIEVEWLRCAACGSDEIVYNKTPGGLPSVGTCLMGSELTGEPGAEQCARCGSYEIVQDGTRRVPKYTFTLCTEGVLPARRGGSRRVRREAGR